MKRKYTTIISLIALFCPLLPIIIGFAFMAVGEFLVELNAIEYICMLIFIFGLLILMTFPIVSIAATFASVSLQLALIGIKELTWKNYLLLIAAVAELIIAIIFSYNTWMGWMSV